MSDRGYSGWLVAYKQSIGDQSDGVSHFTERQPPLVKESNGYCPICGHWSISTNVVIDEFSEEKGDKCNFCYSIFEASNLSFIDSKTCECGHPRDYHEESILDCRKGHETAGCKCKKYRPTQVIVELERQ